MLIGRFGQSSGRPYVEGYVSLPHLQCAGLISFLVDTGADKSTVSAEDALRLPIRYDLLKKDSIMSGIGGMRKIFIEPAVLAFVDDSNLHYYAMDIAIMENDPSVRGVPSILGRDILDRWRMTYCPAEGHLDFEVLSADTTFSPP